MSLSRVHTCSVGVSLEAAITPASTRGGGICGTAEHVPRAYAGAPRPDPAIPHSRAVLGRNFAPIEPTVPVPGRASERVLCDVGTPDRCEGPEVRGALLQGVLVTDRSLPCVGR